MNNRYQFPDRLFLQLVEVAQNVPDPMRTDAKGVNHGEAMMRWRVNLRVIVEQIAQEAWTMGGAWGLGQAQKAEYMVVTQEQYERLKEAGHGEQTNESRGGEASP